MRKSHSRGFFLLEMQDLLIYCRTKKTEYYINS